jgi:hypothetical protein
MRSLVRSAALGLLVAGCVGPQGPEIDPRRLDATPRLDFATDGATTRGEAVARLGEPAAALEGGRILAFALVVGRDARLHVVAPPVGTAAPWMLSGTRHALVLVFGADGVLERHALVPLE